MQPASRYIFVISRFIYPEPSPDQIGSDMKRSMNIRVAISHANGPFLLKSIPQESVTFWEKVWDHISGNVLYLKPVKKTD